MTVAHNTPKAINLTATDPDNGPRALTYEIVSQPTRGALTGTPPNVTYTPNSGYSGSDSFKFRAYDGAAYSNTATVSITVEPPAAQAPATPSKPSPAHQAQGVSIETDLDWADAARAASYDVYFGTTNPPTTLLGNTTSSAWTLGRLSYQTTYYWKLVAKNSAGTTAGPVWRFTTQGQSSAGPCEVDYLAERNLAIIEHGPGACENTGAPGPSLEFYNVTMPGIVAPGQQVTFRIDWNRCSDCNPNAVIYTSLIGSWAPSTPLYVSNAYFTSCDQTAVDQVVFTAPTTPGQYRLRWMLCMAFEPLTEFCGTGYGGSAWDVQACPYVEVSFTVQGQSSAGPCEVDYLAERNLAIIEHGPGACETLHPLHLEFYNVTMPDVVAPGQQVTFRIDWNRCSDCNPNAVIYTSLIGSWAPSTPLYVSNAYFTSCTQTAVDEVVFTAPTTPGQYRLRWMLCMAFEPLTEFCGTGYGGSAWDVQACPYVEVSFSVN